MALKHAMTLQPISKPGYQAYLRWKLTAKQYDQKLARECVAHVLADLKASAGQKRFSLATAFPGDWPPGLTSVWEYWGEDKLMAALTLGCIVMEYLIDDDHEWLCFRTDLQDRGFDTNFYWCNNCLV